MAGGWPRMCVTMVFTHLSKTSEGVIASSDFLYSMGNMTDWQRTTLEGKAASGVECLLESWNDLAADPIEGAFCGPSWDGDFCWPATLVGDTAKLPCINITGNYGNVNESRAPIGFVFRTCYDNASWSWSSQTNDSGCTSSEIDEPMHDWLMVEIIRYVLFLGSILSLLFLGISLFIFHYLKSIRCDRILIHIHFMISLALKSFVLVVISEPYVFGEEYHYRSVEWICKLVLALNLYTYVASINWMFVQGHYLNSKLTTDIFQTKFNIKYYCCFGWGLPVAIVLGWCTAMEAVHTDKEVFCWKGYSLSLLIWMIVGPVLAALLANLVFLVNVTRVLLTKLQLTSNSSDMEQFRRAAKATTVLFPLLGINNLIFFFNPGGSGQIYYMLANAILQPLQGILVSILYCFVTNDVRKALRRKYNRFSSRRNFRDASRRSRSVVGAFTMAHNGFNVMTAGTIEGVLAQENIANSQI